VHSDTVGEAQHAAPGTTRDAQPEPAGTVVHQPILDPEARFAALARPTYDPDARGIRRGAAPTLSLVGGLLVAVSPFGAWLRLTRLSSERVPPEVVHEELGRQIGPGFAVAVLGVLAVLVTRLWNRKTAVERGVAHVVALTAAGLAGVGLLYLQARITDVTQQVVEDAGFLDFNVGAGWGAWAALSGASALLLASVFALLSDTRDKASTARGVDR
jgi:hypothetical protein